MATQVEVAKHLDLSEQRVRELMSEGIIPKAARRNHDLEACRVAYIRYLREVAAGRTSADGKLDLAQERAKLAIQQTEKLELENAEKRGELVPKDDYLATAGVIMSTIRTRVLAIGSKVQHAVAAETVARECRKVIDGEARDALDELSRLTDFDASGGD